MRSIGRSTRFLATLVLVSGSALAEEDSLGERFLFGGEVTANLSPRDPGYFNETEYLDNGLRLLRLNAAFEFRVSDRLSVLSEVRSDNLDGPRPYALYLRFRPWRERVFDLQAGRIPPVFGAFSRRRYDSDNPVIGYPLAYQYPTLVRSDAAPRNLEELLGQRGRGAKLWYGVGESSYMAGLPLVNPLQWDTGLMLRAGRDPVELAVSLTQGTISNPRVEDDNSGKQLAGRLGWRPAFGWILGFSVARGEYVSDRLASEAAVDGHERRSHQTSLGLDLEVSRGHWILRAESIWNRWEPPTLEVGPLDASSIMIEGRYKLSPGFYLAMRAGHLTFGRIETSRGRTSWDAPVTRIEVGAGYNLHRQLLLKLSIQYNERDAGPRLSSTVPAVQLLFWF